MSNPMQPLDPSGVPSPLTPADGPSSPSGYAGVTPHGQGPAPYNIQADMENLDGLASAAMSAIGSRQSDTESLLSSPAGYGEFAITTGMSGGGGDDWPSDVRPGPNATTPDQGMGDFTGTGTD